MFDKRLAHEVKPVSGYLILTIGLGIGIALLAVAQAWFFSRVVAGVFLEGATLSSAWNFANNHCRDHCAAGSLSMGQ